MKVTGRHRNANKNEKITSIFWKHLFRSFVVKQKGINNEND